MLAGIVTLICLAVVLYTYFGYPLLLLLICSVRKRRSEPDLPDALPPISVVVCAANAERTIGTRIRNLLEQDVGSAAYEIVVASDGSADRTADVARETFAETSRDEGVAFRVFDFRERRGKAAVLNEVVPQCAGELVVLGDVRQDFAPDAIRRLCARFADPSVGAVSGELVFRRSPADTATAEGLDFYWRYEKMLRKLESCVDSTSGCTGAIYAIRRELFRPIDASLILDDVAIPFRILMQGKRVIFEESARAYDTPTQDARIEHRRKVRTLAGNLQLCRVYPELLNPFRNRIWWQFVSHKMLRLICPWLLAALLVGSGRLVGRSAWAAVLFTVQLALYAFAVAGLTRGSRVTSRFLAIPRAFVLLNWAAVVAWLALLRGDLSPAWTETPVRE